MGEKISAKQQEILEYIKSEILDKGYPPSVREICDAVHLKSTSSVHSHLETLERNGFIRRDPTKPRAIEIMDDVFNLVRREVVNVPLVGTVAAGQPLLAEENIESYFPIPVEMLPNKETFMLRVKGESMINAGIFDGDRVIIQQQSHAENGEIVVEASHGAAPDIAGREIANPIALILSGALLLRHIGRCDQAERVERAVREVLNERVSLTPDLGGTGTTMGVAEAIVGRM